ncbi:hypothetical protein M422DRAFT_176136, partial [Sphaerobolus stellatus SS14]
VTLSRAVCSTADTVLLDVILTAVDDHNANAIIQKTPRNRLSQGVTALTFAHRLQTTMDADKVVGAPH